MKKILLFLLCAVLILPVSAALPKVVDGAGLLSNSDISALEDQIAKVTDIYEMDIVILTVDTLDGKRAQDYADDYFDENGYGLGANNSGILFLIDMGSRSWAVSTAGEAIRAVPDSRIDSIMSAVQSELSSGRYAQAFTSFVTNVEQAFKSHASAAEDPDYDPYDPNLSYEEETSFGEMLLISVVIGAVVAGIALLVMRSKMNTAKAQSGAKDYMTEGSFLLYQHHDIFLYSRTTKTPKPDNNSGGSHRSSSGRSHGGRSGRF